MHDRSVDCRLSFSEVVQQYNLKYLVKLNKTPTDYFQTCTEAYGEDCIHVSFVFRWHKNSVKNVKCGRQWTTWMTFHFKNWRKKPDCSNRLSTRCLNDTWICEHWQRQWMENFAEDFNLKNVCAKLLSMVPTLEQKKFRKFLPLVYSNLWTQTFFRKKHSLWCNLDLPVWAWDKNGSQCTEKHCRRQDWRKYVKASPNSKLCYLFFDIKSIILEKWVPEVITVNQHY